MNREFVCCRGVFLNALTFPRRERSEAISPGCVCVKSEAAIIKP